MEPMKPAIPPDPVEQDADGKWWFYNEVWSDKYGPYETKEAVAKALWTYCVYELGISKEEMNQYEPTRQNQEELDNQGNSHPRKVEILRSERPD